jgi:hypothetical protein
MPIITAIMLIQPVLPRLIPSMLMVGSGLREIVDYTFKITVAVGI